MSLIKLANTINYDHLANQVNGSDNKAALVDLLKTKLSKTQFEQFSSTLKKHEDHWKARAAAQTK